MSDKQGKRAAIAAFRTVLAGVSIAGGYHANLAGRVYPTMLWPSSLPFQAVASEQWVYVCCPLLKDGVRFEENGTTYYRRFFLRAFIFAQETANARDESEGDVLADVEDDLVRAVLYNQRLNNTCELCEPADGDSDSGWPRESQRYGYEEVAFQVTQLVSFETLGT